jgi:hypothetical protein
MTSHDKGDPRRGRPGGLAAKPDARGDSTQLTLWAEAIPAHPLAPAERHLRLLVNVRPPERHHWWLYTWDGRHQREFLQRLGWWAA